MTIPLDYTTEEDEPLDQDQSEAILRSETQALAEDLPTLNKYRDYYDGEQLLSYGTDRFKTEFGEAFEGLVSNWCEVVVDAVLDKLAVIGVKIPEQEELSKLVWETLRNNDLDEQHEELHEGILVEGRCYAIIWPDEDLGARFDWNPAQNVRVRYADDDARTPVWAIKRWLTPSGVIRVNLYFPDRIEKWQQFPTEQQASLRNVTRMTPETGPQPGLSRFETEGEPWPLPNPFGEIPVVEFSSRKGSEIKTVIPQQDGVNYLLTSAFGAAEFNAMQQKVMMTNVAEPTGGWSNHPGRVWHLPAALDSDGKPITSSIGEFSSTDLAPYRSLIEMTLQHVALTSKTPVRMFFQSDRGGRGDAPSGEALRVEDQPLIDKVQSRQIRYGNSWYRVVRLVAKAVSGDFGMSLPMGEVIWQDTQADYRSALLDDALKMKELGMPYEFIVKKLGLNPEETALLIEMGKEEPEVVEVAAETTEESDSSSDE